MNGLFSPENRAAVRDLWKALRDLSRELRRPTADAAPPPEAAALEASAPEASLPWWRDRPSPAPSATTTIRADFAPDISVAPAALATPSPAHVPPPAQPATPARPTPARAVVRPVRTPRKMAATSGKLLLWGARIRATSGKLRRSWGERVATTVRDARRDSWRDAGVAMREMRSAGANAVLAGISVVRHRVSGHVGLFHRMWTDARHAVRAMAKAARVRMWTDATESLKAMTAAALAAATLATMRSRLIARHQESVANGPASRSVADRAGVVIASVRAVAERVLLIASGATAAAVAKARAGIGRAWVAAVFAAGVRKAAGTRRRVAAARFAQWARGTGAGVRDAWRELRADASRVWAIWRANGFRVPDAAKVSAGGIAVVVVVLGIGYGAGHLGQGKRPAAQVTPSATPSIAPQEALVPAVVAIPEAGPIVLPLSRFNPITGPGRPPLPEDVNGPQGSLKTTGTYEVALTFDDGPDPRWTPEVLNLLRQYRVKATFCVIGVNVVSFPELVRQIDAEGHTLCNHSWGHDTGLGNRSYGTILSDMQRTNDAIRAAAPRARISYFRHPGGAWTQNAVSVARNLGMTSLHWDVDPRDWLKPGARSISSTVVGSTVPGSIVLMHDGGGDRRGTTDALRSILPNLVTRFPLVALPPGVDPPKLYGIQLPIHAGQE